MAQNFLYMFEFVVDDILITRVNKCAPEEYPTCCEISFRSSVFLSICDREFGYCVDTCAPKSGKVCLFSLESPVTEKDRLLIHVYKKKDENCKYLLGAGDTPVKPLFDNVTAMFDNQNPNWMESVTRHNASTPDPKVLRIGQGSVTPQMCDRDIESRREQFCPSTELVKSMLPLFNMKGEQTGNLVLIIRLICNGPAIVSSFPFSMFCKANIGVNDVAPNADPFKQQETHPQQLFGELCPMPVPCQKPDPQKAPMCDRYFACNDDKGCPCDACEDKFDRDSGRCSKPKEVSKVKTTCCSLARQTGGECCSCPKKEEDCEPKSDKCSCCDMDNIAGCEADDARCGEDEVSSDESCTCMTPCFIEPSRPQPGPESYEEFVACLNGSGVTIRVLKDAYKMETIYDGTANAKSLNDSDDEFGDRKAGCNDCETLEDILNHSSFAKNSLRRRTAGHIVNSPRLPKVRANIKYAGTNTGTVECYNVPFTSIKNKCEGANKTLDKYRKLNLNDDCGPIVPPKPMDDTRSCCLQVDPNEIKDMLKGVNIDARKKGIEVCYKTCDDPDSDVFLVKLGSKKSCEHKQHSVEIELKTPKVPIVLPVQTISTETQIKENELDAALASLGRKKGKKGKKGKK